MGAPGLAASGPMAGKTVKAGVVADVTGAASVYGSRKRTRTTLANDDIKSGMINAGGEPHLRRAGRRDRCEPGRQLHPALHHRRDDADHPRSDALRRSLQGAAARGQAPTSRFWPLRTPPKASPPTARCVFRDSLSETQVIPTTVKPTRDRWKYKTAAIIYGDDNAFTKTDCDIFRNELKKNGVQIVDVETYQTGDVDFQAQ